MSPITFQMGLRDADRAQAAALYFEAFRQKLGPFLGDKGEALIAGTFNLDRAITATRGEELVGLAGVQYGGRALVGIDWPDIRRAYGLLSGVIRAAAAARGEGVGSELLRRVVDLARGEGFEQVRLDVVDTNPGARRLYERRGFVAMKTESAPWLRGRFGFGASTTMVKHIDNNGETH